MNDLSTVPFSCLLCVLLLCSTSTVIAQSNEGTNFWFGFMEHRDVNANSKVAMITSKVSTSGTISIPNQNWSQDFTVNANTVNLINLPLSAETTGSELTKNTGIHITTLAPVSVYIHQYHDARSEASIVLPNASIGDEYYVMSYPGYLRQSTVFPSEFLIVAAYDETIVTITVNETTRGGRSANTTFDVTLNAGEAYQVQANDASSDFTGSYVSGDKDFALFAGNSWTEVPQGCSARDNLVEQMYPISTWGKQFVTVPNANLSYDVFRILAAQDNTMVEVHGSSVNTYTLNAGEFVEYQKSEATYINASHSVLVAQYMVGQNCNGHFLGDPSLVLLNSIEQTRDTVTLYNSSFENITENYINITMAASDIESVTIDGISVMDNYNVQTIGLADEFAYARIPVAAGAHTIISAGCGVSATAYGYGNVESYAYGGGASFKDINANPIPEGGCLNDTILFDTGLPPERYSFQWDLGDGTMSEDPVLEHIYDGLGTYPVEVIITDHCLETIDTSYRDLLVSLRQAVDAEQDTLLCEGEAFSLGATDLAEARYEWTGPAGYFSEEQFPRVFNARPEMTGQYAVVGIISGCATFPAFTEVEVIPTPVPYLGEDTIICTRGTLPTLNPGNFAQYSWQDGSVNPTFTIAEEGNFWVDVVDEYGCIGTDSVSLREICATRIYIPNAFSPNDDGRNDTFNVYGGDFLSLKLTIFSRWGELIYESTEQDKGWDGKFRGAPLPEGVYTWQLEYEGYLSDGSTYFRTDSGAIALLR